MHVGDHQRSHHVPGRLRLVLYLVNMLPVDGRTKQIISIIVIIIGIVSLLKALAVFPF